MTKPCAICLRRFRVFGAVGACAGCLLWGWARGWLIHTAEDHGELATKLAISGTHAETPSGEHGAAEPLTATRAA